MNMEEARLKGLKTGIPLSDEDAFLRRDPKTGPPLPLNGKKFIALLILKTTVLFLCCVSVYFLFEYGKSHPAYTVQLDNLIIETGGQLNPKDIRTLIHKQFPSNLITFNIKELRKRIENLNWVRNVTIRKIFPNRLAIHVTEKKPVGIAKTDRLWLFDVNGDFLGEYLSSKHNLDRPVLIGLQSDNDPMAGDENRERIRRYLQFIKEIDNGEKKLSSKLSEVDMADSSDIIVIPMEGAPKIHLGYEKLRKRLEGYFQIINMARDENGPISEIDMRYDDKIIVKPIEPL